MNNEGVFSIWAPDDARWSRWVKPVLFAHLDSAQLLAQVPVEELPVELSWSPAIEECTAIVVDLPGAEGVRVGLKLAARGFRPVPLYNAVPLPFTARSLDPLNAGAVAAVDLLPIVAALKNGTEQLAQFNLPTDAPPAFLLDSNRHGEGRTMLPNQFDNRAVCFTTDFPSANFLRASGIERVVLIQRSRIYPLSDLAHILRRWQDGGIALERARVDFTEPRQPFEVSKPSWYGMMFQRALMALGLRRAGGGGFGSWVPVASAGG
jgi:hypothetical protein